MSTARPWPGTANIAPRVESDRATLTPAAIPAELAEIHAEALSIEVLPSGDYRMDYGTHIEVWPGSFESARDRCEAIFVQCVHDQQERLAE